MSISVHCEECGKTYQVRDEMAGRKGKCPKGHAIAVPATAPVEENEFAFDTGPRSKSGGESASRKGSRPAAEPAVDSNAADDEFAFKAAPVAPSKAESSKTGRHRYAQKSKAAESNGARKTMMPMILGGVLAMVGIGGGIGLLLLSRAEVGPLRDKAEAATKRADDAESKMRTAEAVAAAAEANLAELRKNPPKPPPDPALKEAQKKISALENKLKELEARPAVDAKDPLAKNNSPAPKADIPDAGPAGGKNWTAPATVMAGLISHKAGDRLWIRPQEDATLKAANGIMRVKFRYELRKGKELPAETFGTVLIFEAGSVTTSTIPVTLKGENGAAEAAFDVKGLTGSANITFFISDGKLGGGGKNLSIYSSFIATSVEF
jgi:hypothetical protein